MTHVGSLIVWNFKGWNIGTPTEAGDIDGVLCMDLPTKRDAVACAQAHEAGLVDLREHEWFDHDAHVGGLRSWGGYAPIYQHRSRCSCGWSEETESKADGRRQRAAHILALAGKE